MDRLVGIPERVYCSTIITLEMRNDHMQVPIALFQSLSKGFVYLELNSTRLLFPAINILLKYVFLRNLHLSAQEKPFLRLIQYEPCNVFLTQEIGQLLLDTG